MASADMAYPSSRLGPATACAVRPEGALRSKISSLNRLANMISEDVANISQEIDRVAGTRPSEPCKPAGERPEAHELDSFQTQLDRLDRLAQYVREQLDRLRAI